MPVMEVTSIIERSLLPNIYGGKLDYNTKTKDLTSGAYSSKMLAKQATYHIHLPTILFLRS